MLYFPTLFLSLFITITLIPIFKTMAMKVNAVDFPNERKIHSKPIPKVGGIAFALGALIPVLFLQDFIHLDRFIWAVIIGACIIVLFGFLDDLKDLGYKAKFLGQLIASLVVMFYGELSINNLGSLLPDGIILPTAVAIPLTLITIIGVTNAINLADGLDGLAGGISLLSFVCIGYLAYRCEYFSIAVMCAAMVGGLFGFLRFNTFPATIFMGDAGSQLIGFLAVTLSLKLTQGNTPLSPVLPLLLLGFPVLDTLMVMAERKMNGRPMFVADKNHFHHKLMKIGLYHKEAVFFIYVIQAILVTFGFLFRFYSEWILLTFYIFFSGLIFTSVLWGNKKGYQFNRPSLIDKIIKPQLKVFKEELLLIKITYRAMQIILPVIVIFSVFLLGKVPLYISPLAALFVLLVLFSATFIKTWTPVVLRLSFYIIIPYLIYIGETNTGDWTTENVMELYNISYIILAFFVVLTVKLTRRSQGFKATPMDFIILFTALAIPNLPDIGIGNYGMGMVAIKIIVLFFSFEVWICEQRENLFKPLLAISVPMVVLAIRGVL